MSYNYEGYGSYNQQISQTQQYEFQNNQNQTYEERSKLMSIDALNDITNKIKISDALKSTVMKSIHTEQEMFSQSMLRQSKFNLKKLTERKSLNNKIKCMNLPLQIKGQIKKSQNNVQKAKQLIYFQQSKIKKTIKHGQSICQQRKPQTYRQNQVKQNKNCKQINPKNQRTIPEKIQFFKNNPLQSVMSDKECVLTSHSGYNFAISQDYLQNMSRFFNQQDSKTSLKQRIQQRLNTKQILKTLPTEGHTTYYKYDLIKHYSPLDPKTARSTTVLSSQPFYERQNKTMLNKKQKVQKLRLQKLNKQIVQCSFKPKTNLHFRGKNSKKA